MQALIGICVLCIIPGFVSFLINKRCSRKRINEEGNDLKKIVFYWLFFYGILSFVKLMLGDKTISLYESFGDILPQTYSHYGVPLVIISIALPFIFQIILVKSSVTEFAAFFDSCMFAGIIIIYTLFGTVSNFQYVGCILISIIFSLVKCFFYKKQVSYCNSINDAKRRIKSVLPVMLFWAVTVLIYLPNELFLNNVGEFQFTYGSYLCILLLGSLIFIVIGTLGSIYFLTQKQCDLVSTLIFAWTFGGYIQGNFLNGTLAVLDGTKQVWSSKSIMINSIIWIFIVGGVLFLALYKKKSKICTYLSMYICLMQLVSLVVLVATTDMNKENEYALTTESMLKLDNENNVIVFVLDWFDEQIMEKVIKDDSLFLQPLNDFTWYQNASSCYAFTNMSLPYLLTGTKWEYDMLEEDYCKYAYKNSNFLPDIKEYGYDIGIYTDSVVVDSSVKDIVTNYKNVQERKCDFGDTIFMMSKCSKYKMAPFAMKSCYWYASSDINGLIVNDDIYKTHEDWSFYNLLMSDKISVHNTDDKGVFRFYHLYGVHLPYIMDENVSYSEDSTMLSQARGCLRIIYEYIEQMKANGVYDDATIIITADHGQNTYLQNREEAAEAGFDVTSNPILFVKRSGETGKTDMNISMAPVSHEEFAATIMNAVGMNSANYGKTFEQIDENEDRDRTFIFGRHYDFPFTKYIINGNVRDGNDWKEVPIS